jgi:DedD protein
MAKQLTADEESTLKRQARRRLIGAVALITLVVIALPLIFDSEPVRKNANDIELRIPDKDKAGEFKPRAGLPEVAAVSSVLVSDSAPESIAASAPSVVPVSKPISQNDSNKSAPAQIVAAQHSAEKNTKVEPKNIETKPVAKADVIPQNGFVVQVGAFSNASSAKSLQEKLGKQGFHAYTEKVGDKKRVRVGSYPNREAAEKARHKLESIGLHPNVINLD